MKQLLFSTLCFTLLFSSCDTKPQSAEKVADAQMNTQTTTATNVPPQDTVVIKKPMSVVATSATMPPFSVKYVGKKGFYINDKLIGEMSGDKASKTIADAMFAYQKQGGIIPKDLNLEIVHDPKTSEPLMGVTGDLRSAFADAVTIFNGSTKMPASIKNGTTCYQKIENKVDFTKCQLTIKGEEVTGKYNWEPNQKDGAYGNFKGKLKGNIITGIYSYTIEGSKQKDEITFMLDNGVLKEGVGEHGDPNADGISYFTDKSKIKYTKVFTAGDCAKIFK